MPKKSFKFTIIIPTVLVLIVLVVALNVFLSVRYSALTDDLIDEKLSADINSLKNYLDECKANSRAAAISMAFNNTAIHAIKERDTALLLDLFTPTQDMYRINFFTICDNEGIVLARTHEPDHFGDSVINQQNIRDALAGKVSTYFEEGTAVKVSVRTGTPIYDTDGVLIGVVSTGTRFDTDSEVEKLKDIFKAEVTVFLGETRISTTIMRNGQTITGTKIATDIVDLVVKNKQEYVEDADIMGEKYKKFYLPLINSKNEAFATFVLALPEAEIIGRINNLNRNGIIFGFCGLAISIALLFIIISSISKPITKLSDDLTLLANGNLQIDINTKGEDEVGVLGKSLKGVADTLNKLLKGINAMISEYSKGNTDYTLEASEFSGAYKTLAENILELVSISTNDQLTGLPNKRNFKSRLEWEWKRAIKEQTPISILMLDVDNFENYRETFGQQQSDMALHTIAETIKQAKRSKDFPARWDRQKFSILLQGTDSDAVVDIAEGIRRAIEDAVIPCTEEKYRTDARCSKVTVSIGISIKIPMQDVQISDLISLADVSLYQAKENGMNSVVMCQTDFET